MTNRTLSQRLRVANALLIFAVLLLGTIAVTSLFKLEGNTAEALDEYGEIQLLAHALDRVERAQLILDLAHVDPEIIIKELTIAQRKVDLYIPIHEAELAHEEEEATEIEREKRELKIAQTIQHDLIAALTLLEADSNSIKGTPNIPGSEQPAPATSNSESDPLIIVLDSLAKNLHELVQDPDLHIVQAEASRRTVLGAIFIGIVSLFIIFFVILISLRLHKQIVGSVRRLQAGVRTVSAGRFTDCVEETGDTEIVELARDFNLMAKELDTLYRQMESRIEEKSREIVRSERLASVGFLAAGVAHEINNPLGIISGYASISRKGLIGQPNDAQLAEAREALDIIKDEAFRCKKIVEQLVTLSMVGDESREPVAINTLVSELLVLVRGLDKASGRHLSFVHPSGLDIMVLGNPVELKQVLLNLIVNALGATEVDIGEIKIHLEESNQRVSIVVKDNGCGIKPDSIENVFEPFYTRHSAGDNHRLGLGLTISHAIVDAHGGRLRVQSDGLGKGSRFIVELPTLMNMEPHHATAHR